MKKNISIIIGLLFLVNGKSDLFAQSHDLQLILNKNTSTTCSKVSDVSYMSDGEITKEYILMERIVSNGAGYIYFQTDENYASTDNIVFSLTDENNSSRYFRVHIFNDDAILESSEETIPPCPNPNDNPNHKCFNAGDSFRIVRCGCRILYYRNESLVHEIMIADDNFPLVGEITVNNATDVGLHVQFDQTHEDGNCGGAN